MNKENISFLISFLKLCPSIERVFINSVSVKNLNPLVVHAYYNFFVLIHLIISKVDSNTYSSKEEVSVADHAIKHTRILKNLKLVKLEGSKSEEDKSKLILALQEIVDIDQPLLVLF